MVCFGAVEELLVVYHPVSLPTVLFQMACLPHCFSCYFSLVLCGTHMLLILSNLLVIFLGLLVLPLFSVQFLFLLLDNIIKLWRADGAFPNLLVKRCNL